MNWDLDTAIVVLGDGAISVDGVMVSGSRVFMRDPRIHHPTERMMWVAVMRELTTAKTYNVPVGYKYCCSGRLHAAPFGDAILPLSEFGVDRSRPDGLNTQCKACRNAERRRVYRASVGHDVRETRARVA